MFIMVNSINYNGSLVDGPGLRTTLFLQGCEKKCVGCHNPSSWDIDNGTKFDINNLADQIKKRVENKKLTITGGEPLLQVEALLELIKLLYDFDICLYTGYDLDNVPNQILEYLTYIKVGPYIKELRCTTKPFIGSINQQFIRLKEVG